MEEAFYDEHVAPYVGMRIWWLLVPLLLAEVGLLAWHHQHCVRSGVDDEVAGGSGKRQLW